MAEGKPPTSAFSESASTPVEPEAGSSAPTDANRPTSARRPRTGTRRPNTKRVATPLEGLGDLPDQQFYPEGDDFDEDDEFDDEEPDKDVFAFERPATSAVPNAGFSDYTTSVPGTSHMPTTAGTSAYPAPTTAGTHVTGGTFGFGGQGVASPVIPGVRRGSTGLTPPGAVDVGGHIPELAYDINNPPPFSGRQNPNNSAFAFAINARQARDNAAASASSGPSRPHTGRSLFNRMQRKKMGTATTAMTGTSHFTTTEDSRASFESEAMSETGSYASGEGPATRPANATRRMRSSQPLISGADSETALTSEAGTGTRRGMSRGSYGMTELTGDMTVPDGKTTWGDGMGGMAKDSEVGEEAVVDFDMAEEDSPYAEVRASVSNIDDPDMPALTIRAFVIGMIFTILGTALNTFFFLRFPSPYISPLLVQVAAYPVGKFFAWFLPIRTFYLPSWLTGRSFSLNPGPFNIKEHTIIVMMANVGLAPAYAMYAIVSLEKWYEHPLGLAFNIFFLLSTQLTGFAFAGLARRFVVFPASMIWPGNLVIATNLNAFHAEEDGFHGGMSRLKFLLVAGGAAFAWYFLPGYLFTALSYFSYACWIVPDNIVVNQLFGVSTGLGMGVLTFDWVQIAYIGSPLTTPWWAAANIAIGFILFYWIITPILYYTNVWEFSYIPISTVQAADRFGDIYETSAIVTADLQLNETAYAEYSPVYLSASFSMTFMLAFALSTALIMHTLLFHGPRIWKTVRNMRTEIEDIHMKLMRKYPEVPDWWFLLLLGATFIMAVAIIEKYKTELPVWGYIISVLLPLIYLIPAAFIYAMTNQTVAINLLAELIPGYLFQGKTIAGMISKSFSTYTLYEALYFVSDQKLGHYMKIPPRSTYIAQLSATIVAGLIQIGTKELLFATVPDICHSGQANLLNCSNARVFYTSSIIWSLVGPARLFSKGALYHPQLWAILAGAVLPIPIWLWTRKYRESVLRNVNLAVIFNGALSIPPATGINYASWLVTSFIFQFWVRRRRFAWWSKYNYVLSAALEVGTALSALVLFLVFGLAKINVNWWGNTVYQNTGDYNGVAYRSIPEKGYFGPDTWKV